MKPKSKYTTTTQQALLQAASVLDQSAAALDQHRRCTGNCVRAECLADLVISLREISSGLYRLSILLANSPAYRDSTAQAAQAFAVTKSATRIAGRA